MIQDSKNRPLAMLGCGLEGEKLYYQMYRKEIKIECVLDNAKTGLFHGKQICNVEEMKEKLSMYYILVSTVKYYREIKAQLENYGLEEFEDFIIGGAYGKKLAVINANCYGGFIKAFLCSSEEFSAEYYIYPSRPVHVEFEKGCDEAAIKRCDLLLTQDIREENPYGVCYSEQYVRSLIKEQCVCMTIPNLLGMGKIFFLQAKNKGDWRDFPMFQYDDENVLVLAAHRMEETEIITTIMNGRTYDKNQIIDNFKTIINKFKEREKHWDIKIVDFILERYQEEKVFFENDHCTNIVYKRMAQEILRKLEILDEDINCNRIIDEAEMPIYPEVREVLGLKYGGPEELIRTKHPNTRLTSKMNIEEWLHQYIYWNDLCKRDD